VVEIAEVLQLHGDRTGGPTVWVVLTAREYLTRSSCTAHLRQLRKAARRRWPMVEWFVQVEAQVRGALHLNLLVMGVPAGDAASFLAVISTVWCARVDALPQGQWCEAVGEGPAVARYVTKLLVHGLKGSQAMPIGWRGHRTSQTGRYFDAPMPVLRAEARRSLAVKREVWKRMQVLREQERESGSEWPPEVWAELQDELVQDARQAVERAAEVTWLPIRLPT
jgi:hypothetical protein